MVLQNILELHLSLFHTCIIFVSIEPYDHACTKQLNKSCTKVKFFLAKEFQQ